MTYVEVRDVAMSPFKERTVNIEQTGNASEKDQQCTSVSTEIQRKQDPSIKKKIMWIKCFKVCSLFSRVFVKSKKKQKGKLVSRQ